VDAIVGNSVISDIEVAAAVEGQGSGAIQPSKGGAGGDGAGGKPTHRGAIDIGDVKVAAGIEGQCKGPIKPGEDGAGGVIAGGELDHRVGIWLVSGEI